MRRIFFPHAHEYVVKKWIDKELGKVSVRVDFTEGALEFIKVKCAKESSVLITLSHRYVGSRKGPYSFPCPEIRLGMADPSEDLARVESNAGISVLVAREIYEVFKQQKIRVIVTTSGLWKFKRLHLKQDLSWLLYSKEEMERKGKRWSTL
ncbi:MAG: hypothetical protein ACHQ03_09745 [Candidatus Bathyarchaeia archaeon]